MAVQQVEVLNAGGTEAVNWTQLHTELLEWNKITIYAGIAFGTVVILFLVAILVATVVKR